MTELCQQVIIFREVFYVSIGVLVLGLFAVLWLVRKNHKENTRMIQYTVNVSAEITEDIPSMFEAMVQSTFDDFLIINGEYSQKEYITEAEEEKMMKDLGKMVSSRLSPAMLDKIQLYYNLQHIGEIISDKIYILVTAYVVEKNKVRDTNNPKISIANNESMT